MKHTRARPLAGVAGAWLGMCGVAGWGVVCVCVRVCCLCVLCGGLLELLWRQARALLQSDTPASQRNHPRRHGHRRVHDVQAQETRRQRPQEPPRPLHVKSRLHDAERPGHGTDRHGDGEQHVGGRAGSVKAVAPGT